MLLFQFEFVILKKKIYSDDVDKLICKFQLGETRDHKTIMEKK